jgi:hypothetical protein
MSRISLPSANLNVIVRAAADVKLFAILTEGDADECISINRLRNGLCREVDEVDCVRLEIAPRDDRRSRIIRAHRNAQRPVVHGDLCTLWSDGLTVGKENAAVWLSANHGLGLLRIAAYREMHKH